MMERILKVAAVLSFMVLIPCVGYSEDSAITWSQDPGFIIGEWTLTCSFSGRSILEKDTVSVMPDHGYEIFYIQFRDDQYAYVMENENGHEIVSKYIWSAELTIGKDMGVYSLISANYSRKSQLVVDKASGKFRFIYAKSNSTYQYLGIMKREATPTPEARSASYLAADEASKD